MAGSFDDGVEIVESQAYLMQDVELPSNVCSGIEYWAETRMPERNLVIKGLLEDVDLDLVTVNDIQCTPESVHNHRLRDPGCNSVERPGVWCSLHGRYLKLMV